MSKSGVVHTVVHSAVRPIAATGWLVVVTVTVGTAIAAQTQTVAADQAQVRVPRTAEDHQQLAALYESAAGAYREEAETLRLSWSKEIERLSLGPNKTGHDFPWVANAKAAAHREISAADLAAAEAEHAAVYHRLRARELEGREFARLRRHTNAARR